MEDWGLGAASLWLPLGSCEPLAECLPGDDHPRADADPVIEVDDVVVEHADAAARSILSDGPGRIGAVDAGAANAGLISAGAAAGELGAGRFCEEARPVFGYLVDLF